MNLRVAAAEILFFCMFTYFPPHAYGGDFGLRTGVIDFSRARAKGKYYTPNIDMKDNLISHWLTIKIVGEPLSNNKTLIGTDHTEG